MRPMPTLRSFTWKPFFQAAAAFLCGIILAEALGLALDTGNLQARLANARAARPLNLPVAGQGTADRDIRAFSGKNLFGLSGGAAGTVPTDSEPADVTLLGTFPPLGALFRVNGSSRAVLVGQAVGSETLERVEGTRAFLSNGPGTRTLDVIYAGAGGENPAPPAPRTSLRRSEPRPAAPARSGITAPAGGQDGIIERETINSLLMDPYQELNRVRLRPKMAEDGSPLGIEAQWLHKDSLLLSMGLKSGDVIHSVNDIPIRTTSDIVNAMNSLLNSDRFVIAFFREGADSEVAYSVK